METDYQNSVVIRTHLGPAISVFSVSRAFGTFCASFGSDFGPYFSTLRSAYMGLGIYGFFGYMVHFWMVPNGLGFHTIKYFGYMVNFQL